MEHIMPKCSLRSKLNFESICSIEIRYRNREMNRLKGRIHQIEYAMEAVKQGSATVGVKSKTHAVIVALKVPFY